MLDIRLRRYNDNGTRSRVLKAARITHTDVDSASPVVEFTVSEQVAGQLDAPMLVGVEYTTGKVTPWAPPRNDLFVAKAESSDSTDQTGTVTFTGIGFNAWLLQYYRVWWVAGASDGNRVWTNVTPGKLLRDIITEGQGGGWAPLLTVDFTNTHDSYGQPWPETLSQTFRYFTTPLSQVVESLSSQGYIEWWSEGTILRAVKPGSGVSRPNVMLGGPGATRAPAKVEFDVFTHLLFPYGEDGYWTHVANPGADDRFGTLYAAMSQAGTPTLAAATRNAQPALKEGRSMKRELAYEWTPTDVLPSPWTGFNIGDIVTARTRRGKSLQRVIGTVITKSEAGVTARAVVGSKMLTLAAKTARRAAAASAGSIIAGNGDAMPRNPNPSSPTPVAPTGLHVESNVARWASDGSAVAKVKFAWNEVSQALDLSNIDVDRYELWIREADETSRFATRTGALSVTLDSLRSETPVWVKVRALSVKGARSAFSDEITVTPASPLSIVPKTPTGLALTSNTAAFQADGSSLATLRVQWDAVVESIDDLPVTIERYELRMLDDGVRTPVSASPSRDVTITATSGRALSFAVRAYTTLGVWSSFTAQVDAIAASPDELTDAPTEPTLTTSLGFVQAQWNGVLTSGDLPAGVQHVLVEYAAEAAGPWTRLAVPLPHGGGSAPIRGVVGEEMFVRFVPVDTLGREFTPSDVVSIVVAGITGPDMEANSVTANSIAAGAIEVQHLSNGLGAQIDLGENQVIIQFAADQQALSDQLGETAGAVDELSAWFRVDVDGAHVGAEGSPFQTHVKPDRFEITDNGVVTSYWEGGRMVVPVLETTQVVLAQHKFEPYGDGTVVRSIG
ncbi:hypothetical protein [Microbacterium sp. NPDC058389]|uniref:hypothetical protein n=1 Tax=Microbacterium sp. NPDC058389 TaxID=3346475 RepID=UPI00364FA129